MPRGFEWAIYVGDDGNIYTLRVDADYLLEAARGWSTLGTAGVPPLPRGWRPREVVGIEPSGRLHRARVARLDADLWTGAVTDFISETTSTGSEDLVLCAVIARRGEKAPRP